MIDNDTIQYLEDQIKSNPKSLAFARLAGMYLEQGRVDDAVNLLEQGIQTYPSYVTGHFILAKAYIAKNQREKAEEALKKVISHDKHYLMAHKLLGDLMARIGWENKAAQCYRDILAIDPLDEETEQMLDTFSFAVEPPAAPEITPKKKERDWVSGSPPIFEKSAKVSRHTQQTPGYQTGDNKTGGQETEPDISGFNLDTGIEPAKNDADTSRPDTSVPGELDLSDIDLASFAASRDRGAEENENGLPSGMTATGELDLSDFNFDSSASEPSSNSEEQRRNPGADDPSLTPLKGYTEAGPSPESQEFFTDTAGLDDAPTRETGHGSADSAHDTESINDESAVDSEDTIEGAGLPPAAEEDKSDDDSFFTEGSFPENQDTFDIGSVEEQPAPHDTGTPGTDEDSFDSTPSDIDNLAEIAKLFGEERETTPDTELFREDDGTGTTPDLSELIIEEPGGPEQEKDEEPVDSAPAENSSAEPHVFLPAEDQEDTPAPDKDNTDTGIPSSETEENIVDTREGNSGSANFDGHSSQGPAGQPESENKDEKSMKIVSPTLGEIYSAQGQYKKAIQVYQKLIDKNPETRDRYTQKIRELEQKLEDNE